MKVVFCSNYLTHHQIPLCNALYDILGEDFKFISTQEMDDERKNAGWGFEKQYPYEIKCHKGSREYEEIDRLIYESDIAILGIDKYNLAKKRIKENKIVCFCGERIYKKGRWRVISPRGICNIVLKHTFNNKKRVYMLCASGYAAGDFMMLRAYTGKCFKWGYFPETKLYDNPETIIKNKKKDRIEILWCARFLKWKHPEMAIEVTKRLVAAGRNVHLTMIGNGELYGRIKNLANKYELLDSVDFVEKTSPEGVRRYMENSNIFLFTSDFNEGWGAVLNEAMNSCCCVVASHAIGAVPYLIEDGKNGLVYKNGNIDDLYKKVDMLVENDLVREKLSRNAYQTITEEWNSSIAAKRLLNLFERMMKNESLNIYETGICSKDGFVSNYWYKEK